MRLFKRFGAALLAALTLTAVLTGPVLAAEPAQDSQIAVQLDGKELTFTDATPEITSDRTFLPFRAVLEAMGAEVGYDEATSTVSASKDGVALAMVPGQKTLSVTEDGQTRTVEMDAAPYIKESNGRTYIPVRYAAEAFGYSVGWDQDNKTVILVDVDALFGDATFELLDKMSASSGEQQDIGNMSLAGNLTVDLTDKSGQMLSKPLNVKGSLEGIVGEKGIQLSGAINGAALYAIFGAVDVGPDGSSLGDLSGLLENLPDVTAELRFDIESKTFYVSVPNVENLEAGNTWYSLDLSAYEAQLLDMIDMTQVAELEDAGVREALVWVLKSIPLDDMNMSYPMLSQMAGLYVGMFSDQAFTKNGDTYTSKTTLEDLIDLEITLTQEGEDITAMGMTMSAAAEGVEMTMTMNAAPDKMDMVMDMTVADGEAEMVLHLDLSCAPTDKTPETQPPAGAEVTPFA